MAPFQIEQALIAPVSTNTGTAPVLTIASVVAKAESGVVSTRSPGPQPKARAARSRSRPARWRHPLRAGIPTYDASAASNPRTSSPSTYQPPAPTVFERRQGVVAKIGPLAAEIVGLDHLLARKRNAQIALNTTSGKRARDYLDFGMTSLQRSG